MKNTNMRYIVKVKWKLFPFRICENNNVKVNRWSGYLKSRPYVQSPIDACYNCKKYACYLIIPRPSADCAIKS